MNNALSSTIVNWKFQSRYMFVLQFNKWMLQYISWNHFLKVRQSYYYIAFLTYTVAVCLKIFTAFPKFQGFLIGPKDFLIRFYPITPLYLNGQSALKELSENPYKAMTIYFQSHKRQINSRNVLSPLIFVKIKPALLPPM